jgi:hypothetical protein
MLGFLRRRVLPAAFALATSACGIEAELPPTDPPIESAPEEVDEVGQNLGKPPFGLGVATGGIYVAGVQNLSVAAHRSAFTCEMAQTGSQYVRIEADWEGTDASVYRAMMRDFKARGLKVIVILAGQTGQHCGGDSWRFRQNYVSRLDWLSRNVFNQDSTGDYRPWAWEIGNEPNQVGAESGCANTSVFRIHPDTFAWLMRDVWNWKTQNGRVEKIISGGTLNSYWSAPEEQSFWGTFLRSGAMGGANAGRAPWDYFGVHPYNSFHYNKTCLNNGGGASCFGSVSTNTGWAAHTRDLLRTLATKLDQVNGTTGTRLFVTEFGWQNVGWADGRVASVKTPEQVAYGMNASTDAMQASGVVAGAIWYNYRNNREQFGLRLWDDPYAAAKLPVWRKYRFLASGLTDLVDPETCWKSPPPPPPPPSGEIFTRLVFDGTSTQRSNKAGDWRYGFWKAEVGDAEVMTGLSMSASTGRAHAALARGGSDGWRYPHNSCRVVTFAWGDAGATWDWSSGRFKGECARNEYVAGVAQSTSGQMDSLLCCPGSVAKNSCTPKQFEWGDSREASNSGDWDATYFKGECGTGRYVAGVSRDPSSGRPSTLLCCTP